MKRKLKPSEPVQSPNQDWRKTENFTVIPSINRQISELADEIAKMWFCDVVTDLEERHIISPPEQLFYAQWHFEKHQEDIDLLPQHQVGQYYVDFVLAGLEWFVSHTDQGPEVLRRIAAALPKIAVEIDGHWHEKTPEQVEKDKQRERSLVAAGYTVLRFSAREVFSDPARCVAEVYDLAWDQYLKVRKQYQAGAYA
jgi:very-short-patch-repair endonuclease